jgi:hypothetical protein
MEKNYKNKMVNEAKNKSESKLQEFFYPGGGEYEPITILATSQEKADELYENRRIKVDKN